MTTFQRFILKSDASRLRRAIHFGRGSWTTFAPALDDLEAELDRAVVVCAADMPDDAIPLDVPVNVVDLMTGKKSVCILVCPDETGDDPQKLSVLNSAGMALLGRRVGDIVRWIDRDGLHAAQIGRLRRRRRDADQDAGGEDTLALSYG